MTKYPVRERIPKLVFLQLLKCGYWHMIIRARRIYILINIAINKLFPFFFFQYFQIFSVCFYQVIKIAMKVWENLKTKWTHSPVAYISTASLVLLNFHLCLYLTIRLFTLKFYEVIVDVAEGRINYHLIEIKSK